MAQRIWMILSLLMFQSCSFFGQNASNNSSAGPLASFSIQQISSQKVILDASHSSSFLGEFDDKEAGYLEYRWTFRDLDGDNLSPQIGFDPQGSLSEKNLILVNGGSLQIKNKQEAPSVQYYAPTGGVQNIDVPVCLEVRDASETQNTSPQAGLICQNISLKSSATLPPQSSHPTIGGVISGLLGTVVLQNNNGDNLTLTSSGGFTFATALENGDTYQVTVLTQPSGQTCSVSSGTGIALANVTDVSVVCSDVTYTVGGTVAGLVGTLVLENNSGDDETINANGTYTFNTPVASGANYAVTIDQQPVGQTCIVSNGTGTIASNVTNVNIVCATTTFTVGGSVVGLSGTVVLQNNGGDNEAILANGVYTFNTSVNYAGGYLVTVLTQPAGQFCSVSNATGTAYSNITNVGVVCADIYSLGGVFTGIPSGSSVTLVDNETGQTLLVNGVVSSTGSFTFASPYQVTDPYDVTVQAQSGTLVCSLVNKTGTFTGVNVTNMELNCSPKLCSSVEPKYLKHCAPTANDAMGSSSRVSISENFAAVATPLDDANSDTTPSNNALADSGAVLVYQRDELSGYWHAVDFVKASNLQASDWFGYAVSIDGIHKRMIVGARQEDSNSALNPANNSLSASGAGYIFERDATGDWVQVAYLKHPSPDATDNCGSAVAIDGDFAVMGCPDEDSNSDTNPANDSASASGCAIVYQRSGGGAWAQQDFLKASNLGASDQFGTDVAISGDYIMVGSPGEDSNTDVLPGNNSSSNSGAAYIYHYDGVSNWAQQDFLKASNLGASDNFGLSVDVTEEGYAIVGARNEDSNSQASPANNSASASGAAYIFEWDGVSNWAQQAYLKHPSPTANDLFGIGVGISGNYAVVGAQSEDSDGPYAINELSSGSGAAFVYVRSGGGVWSQDQYLKAFNQTAGDAFGTGVSIHEGQIAIGAINEDSIGTSPFNESASNSGAGYIFEYDSGGWVGN